MPALYSLQSTFALLCVLCTPGLDGCYYSHSLQGKGVTQLPSPQYIYLPRWQGSSREGWLCSPRWLSHQRPCPEPFWPLNQRSDVSPPFWTTKRMNGNHFHALSDTYSAAGDLSEFHTFEPTSLPQTDQMQHKANNWGLNLPTSRA